MKPLGTRGHIVQASLRESLGCGDDVVVLLGLESLDLEMPIFIGAGSTRGSIVEGSRGGLAIGAQSNPCPNRLATGICDGPLDAGASL